MNCPKCDHALSQVTINTVTLNGGKGMNWHGLAYSCPSCLTVLSVGFDPIALKDDLVEEFRGVVRKR